MVGTDKVLKYLLSCWFRWLLFRLFPVFEVCLPIRVCLSFETSGKEMVLFDSSYKIYWNEEKFYHRGHVGADLVVKIDVGSHAWILYGSH